MADEKRGPGRPKRELSVIEKRLSGASPFGMESVAIPLKEPGWTTYIANGGRSDSRLYDMVHVKGWVPLRADDLAGKPDEFGFTVTTEGHVCRGPKGLEVVYKMPVADYQRLVRAKTAANLKTIGSSQKTKQELANAAAATFGPEAGDFVHAHVHGEVRDSKVLESPD